MPCHQLLFGWPRSYIVVFFYLSLVAHRLGIIASPVYDSQHPYRKENFDPVQADPERNITCVGDSYDLQLPMLGDFNPNSVSMQKLCAKPQYNGGAKGQHAGGFCLDLPGPRRSGGRTTGIVSFDIEAGAQANAQLQNPRILLGCFYRCFCNEGLADRSVQPRTEQSPNEMFFDTLQLRSRSTYELQLDINDDFTTPKAQKLGKRGSTRVDSTQIYSWNQIGLSQMRGGGGFRKAISLDEQNYIECRGSLPSFNPPPPFLIHPHPNTNATPDFANTQELCAMQLSGGNIYANAGGYCHRSDGPTGPQRTVWFSDDMTPRLDWTWAGGNFFGAASIRYHCWKNCACKTNPSRDNTSTPLWKFIRNHEIASRDDGSFVIQGTGSTVNSNEGTTILPPQNAGGGASASGTCGPSGTDFCPQTWPTNDYGPAPRAPPNTTDLVESTSINTSMGVCGNTCTGPSDCASTDTQYGCSCAFPSADDAHQLGLDPVVPVAVCLALFQSSLTSSTKSGVGGRSVDPVFVDSRGLKHACMCDGGRTGDACCRHAGPALSAKESNTTTGGSVA